MVDSISWSVPTTHGNRQSITILILFLRPCPIHQWKHSANSRPSLSPCSLQPCIFSPPSKNLCPIPIHLCFIAKSISMMSLHDFQGSSQTRFQRNATFFVSKHRSLSAHYPCQNVVYKSATNIVSHTLKKKMWRQAPTDHYT